MSGCAGNSILFAATEVDERLLECFASFGATFVRTFDDAQRALRDQLFRMIVIDLNFDNVRMFDLLEHVRSLARFNGVPVLCIQGADGEPGITAALDRVVRRLGGKAFLDLRAGEHATERLRDLIGTELHAEANLPRRLCILVIDPDVDAAQRLGEMLEQLGHDVDFAYNAAAGIDAARRLRPDAVFVDVAARPHEGYQLARRLRRECDPGLFLVALAAAPDAEERRRIREAGFEEHVAKSADRHLLSRLLEPHHAHSVR
jgi:CheY-like chemotaxis protein